MRVKHQPSPWPYAALMTCLLLFCLAIPRFWRHEAKLADSSASERLTSEFQEHAELSSTSESWANRSNAVWLNVPTTSRDLEHLWSPPTLEELVAAQACRPVTSPSFGALGQTFEVWPSFTAINPATTDAIWPTAAEAAYWEPNPALLAALEGLAQKFANISRETTLPRILNRSVALYRAWMADDDQAVVIAGSGQGRRATLRLLGPSGTATIAESFRHSPPGELNTDFDRDCWCVPNTLLEQLERLAQQPASADWARRTIFQLHAVLKRGTLDDDALALNLADLADSALEAVHMAESSGDDRLRVELLRAHWALARRIDRWTAMRDIHIARRGERRLASRGS
jgi:hypothetical protein